jgi:hypothetical protein
MFPFDWKNGLQPFVRPQPTQRQDQKDFSGSSFVQGSKYINPLTNDFQINSDGTYVGMNTTDQSVLMALFNTFNATSVANLGNNYNRQTILVIGPFITQQMTNVLQQALGTLINGNFISVVNVVVSQTGQNQMSISFTYYNNSIAANSEISFSLVNGVLSGQ